MEAVAENPVAAPVPAGRDLGALYELHAGPARRFAFLICGDRELAADAVQDAFVRVTSRFGDLRSEDAFALYLRRTVLNVLRNRARQAGREHARLERHARLVGSEELARGADAVAVDPDLWRALQALTDRQRAAVVCRYWLDLSERETARVLGCRPGTVKSLLSRALASLREVLPDA
jgi:RNA polymerase sigma-70 factor (ECF subfamily)